MKNILKIVTVILTLCLFVNCLGGGKYNSFAGTYVVDLTIVQSGHETTIVINRDGTCYFNDGDSYDSSWWGPAEIGDGIRLGGGDEKNTYYMNSNKSKIYWGIDNYMNLRNGYTVRRIK